MPWTDGRDAQEGYAESVELWSDFHDMLDESIPSPIPSRLCVIILRSQLYGCARDQARSVKADTIESVDDAAALLVQFTGLILYQSSQKCTSTSRPS